MHSRACAVINSIIICRCCLGHISSDGLLLLVDSFTGFKPISTNDDDDEDGDVVMAATSSSSSDHVKKVSSGDLYSLENDAVGM